MHGSQLSYYLPLKFSTAPLHALTYVHTQSLSHFIYFLIDLNKFMIYVSTSSIILHISHTYVQKLYVTIFTITKNTLFWYITTVSIRLSRVYLTVHNTLYANTRIYSLPIQTNICRYDILSHDCLPPTYAMEEELGVVYTTMSLTFQIA